jgi:hypothetical protein
MQLREQAIEHDRVREEQHRDHNGQTSQVALDDVRPALRGGCKAHTAKPAVAPRVHQDERDQRRSQQHVDDREEREHTRTLAQARREKALSMLMIYAG